MPWRRHRRAPPPRALPGGGEHRRHVLVAIVLDKPGVLNRVASLMRARNFNIDSLAVSHTDREDISRMTITLHGDDVAVEQAAKQLYRLIDVLKVQDVTAEPTVEHELAFVKIRATDSNRAGDPAARRAVARPGRRPGRWLGHRRGDRHGVRDRRLRGARPDLRHQGIGPHRRRRDGEGFGIHRGGDQAMTARMYYDNDADPAALAGQTVAIIGYGSRRATPMP